MHAFLLITSDNKKNHSLEIEWCLFNIDAYACNFQINLRWNKLSFSREIINQHFKGKEYFLAPS